MKLFIDDVRIPSDVGFVNSEWTIARNYDQAIAMMSLFFPEEISFDHDLGEDSKSGLDVAKYLIFIDEQYIDSRREFEKYEPEFKFRKTEYVDPKTFKFYVHSANPVGKENIEGLLNNYIKFKEEEL